MRPSRLNRDNVRQEPHDPFTRRPTVATRWALANDAATTGLNEFFSSYAGRDSTRAQRAQEGPWAEATWTSDEHRSELIIADQNLVAVVSVISRGGAFAGPIQKTAEGLLDGLRQ